jgi:hypothetical protein
MVALPAVGNTLHCAVHHGTEPALLDVVRVVVEADIHVAGPQTRLLFELVDGQGVALTAEQGHLQQAPVHSSPSFFHPTRQKSVAT